MMGYILTFGKYRGSDVRQLALSDRNYVEWLAVNSYTADVRRMANAALQETAEAAKKLDKYDLDIRYRQEYSADEIEQMRREDAADEAEREAEDKAFDAKHLACRWRGRNGREMTVYIFDTEKPISVYIDDLPVDDLDFAVSEMRELTGKERANPAYNAIVAVLDNGTNRVGLTAERKAAIEEKLKEKC